jgi:hypothetical protein
MDVSCCEFLWKACGPVSQSSTETSQAHLHQFTDQRNLVLHPLLKRGGTIQKGSHETTAGLQIPQTSGGGQIVNCVTGGVALFRHTLDD